MPLSCGKILGGVGLTRFFPVMAEMPKWPEIRACKRRPVWPIYNELHCVVYSFKCQRCTSLYIGQTGRLLHDRISDHLGISAVTGKKRVSAAPTSVLSHERDTRHPVSPRDFNVLSSCPNNSELLMRETLLIRKFNP